MSYFYTTVYIVLSACMLATGGPTECVYKTKAMLYALVPLHSGENCDFVLQRGVQQMAALEVARDVVNRNRGDLPELEIKIYDTCSTSEKAVKGTLQALVQAQLGCKGPLFLGILGPDDVDSVATVSKVLSVFKYPHVVPSAVVSYYHQSTLNFETIDTVARAKSIQIFLEDMNWYSFFLVFTQDPVSTEMAANLIERGNFCLSKTVQKIPSNPNDSTDLNAYNRLLHSLQRAQFSRVLVICDTAESATSLLSYLQSIVHKTRFVVYVQGTGIVPYGLGELPFKMTQNMVALQQTSESTLVSNQFHSYIRKLPVWMEYQNQTNCESCDEFVRDASTTSLTAIVHIFHQTLRKVLHSKCIPGEGVCAKLAKLPANEWRNELEAMIANVREEDGLNEHRLRFHMILDHLINIFADVGNSTFEEIGVIKNDHLLMERPPNYIKETRNRSVQCLRYTILQPTFGSDASVTISPVEDIGVNPTGIPLDLDLFGIDVSLAKLGFYELVAILTGVVVSLVLIILMMICCVYRCFHVKGNDTFSSASSTSLQSMENPKTKQRCKLFAKSRQIHTVQG